MNIDRNLLHFSTVCDGQTYGQTLYIEMIPYDYLLFVTFKLECFLQPLVRKYIQILKILIEDLCSFDFIITFDININYSFTFFNIYRKC